MQPAILGETTHYRGDLWVDGHRIFGPVTVDGQPPPQPCLYCRLQFRHKKTGDLGYELNSSPATGQGTINITSASLYTFEIPNQVLPLDAGVWEWDLETYTTADHSTLPWTIWRGSTKVIQDVSHD